jgi:hypothetical protein
VARKDRMRRKRFVKAKLAGPSMVDENDDRWDNLILTIEETGGEER